MALKIFADVRPLSWKGALRDIVAGITLASMKTPQVLGYTRIAGTPVVTGPSKRVCCGPSTPRSGGKSGACGGCWKRSAQTKA